MKETKQALNSAETRAAMHEVMAAFEAFKASNDERLAEIEAKRADVLLEEKVARIDEALNAAQARLDRFAAEARRPHRSGEGRAADLDPGPSERKAAWEGYIKAGRTFGLEAKALTDGAAGGYLAPPETERAIEQAITHTSPIRSIATVTTIGAPVYQKPVMTNGVASGWAAETAARTETDEGTLALLQFPAADLYACPAATQNLLDDAFINLDQWLAAECEDAFAAQETAAFVTGTGTNQPMGFLSYPTAVDASATWGQLGYVATGAAGAFPADDPVDCLIDLVYTPLAQFRANGRFVMNRRTTAIVRKFKDGEGDYIWTPGLAPGQPSTLCGYPITEVETMPDVGANSFAIAFGDFAKGYLVVDRAGVRVLRDPYSQKPYVLFYTTKRVGGGVQNFNAIKLLKFAAS
jgi:HK97 family phage major capsid protein